MSKKRRDFLFFLEDIDEAISKIQEYTRGMVFEEFKDNKLVVDAVARNFEIIGEAVKNVPKQIKDKYPEVEWKEAAGLRNILIHEYFGVDVEALWDTINNNVDGLKAKISSILQNEHNP